MEQDTSKTTGSDLADGLGETETLPGGGVTVGDAIPEMPPGAEEQSPETKETPGGAPSANS